MKSQRLTWSEVRRVSIRFGVGLLCGEVLAQDPVFNSQNGHWYAAIAEAATWDEAKNKAESMLFNGAAGHLATLTSQAEQDFVANAFPAAVASGYSLGGSQAPDETDPAAGWSWVTGEPWDFTNWLPGGEPNDFGGVNETVLIFHAHLGENPNGYWNDGQPGSTRAGYIVEWEDVDSDGDGIPDTEDDCPHSDRSPTVSIDGCETGVPNVFVALGCRMSDRIAECAANAGNHDEFVSCVAHVANTFRKNGSNKDKDKGRIQRCAAQAALP